MAHWAIDISLRFAMIFTILAVGMIAVLSAINLIFDIVPYPKTLEEAIRHPLLGWYLALAALFATAYGLKSNRDFLVSHLPWKNRVDERISNIERGIKPDLYYSYTYAEKMKTKETKSKSVQNNPKISKGVKLLIVFLVLGFIVLGIAYLFYDTAIQYDRISFRPWQAFDLYYDTSYDLRTLQTTVILNEEIEQFVHVYYYIRGIQDNEPFIAMVIPYTGQLREGDHSWLSKSLSEGGTLIYKQFSCDEDDCNYHRYQNSHYGNYEGNDQYNLLFEINGAIDSNRAGDHSLKIPINGPVDDEASEFVQFDLAKEKVYRYRTGFENVTTSKIAISLPEDISNLNIIPENYQMSYSNFETFNKNKTIFQWDVPNDTASFHLDFTYPSEKEHHEFFTNLSTIFSGIGTTFVIIGIAEYVKIRIESKPSRSNDEDNGDNNTQK